MVQTVRDAVLLVFSFVIAGTTYGKWVTDPVFLIVFPLAAILFSLTVTNIVLVFKKVKRRGFFYANSIAQLPILLIFAGLLGVPGMGLVLLDLAVLATLGEKKSLEEQLRHPPVPITRKYRLVLGLGLLTMVVSMFVPWLSTADFSTPLFSIYVGIATHSNLPGLSISQVLVIFALMTLLFSPAALICGALGFVRRRFSLLSGMLAILAAVSMMIVLGASTGPGTYGFLLGGAVVLAGFFTLRKAG